MKEFKFEWLSKGGNLCQGVVVAISLEAAEQRAKMQCVNNGWCFLGVLK